MHIVKPGWITHDGMPIFSVDINPDCSRFATGGQGADSGLVVIWNLAPVLYENVEKDENVPKMLCQMDRHLACVNCVRWSCSGQYLASGGDDKLVMIWKYAKHSQTGDIVFGSKGKVNTEIWRCVSTLRAHSGDILDLAWSPQDLWLATASVDNTVIVWNAAKLPEIVAVLKGHTGLVKGVAWDPVGKYLSSQSEDKSLRIWRTADWQVESIITKPFKDSSGTTAVLRHSWSPDGQFIVTAHAVNNTAPTSQVIERNDWKHEVDYVGHRKAVTCVRFSGSIVRRKNPRNGKLLQVCVCALGSRDQGISVWITGLLRPLVVLENLFQGPVLDLSWSSTGAHLLACSYDGSVAACTFTETEIGTPLTPKQKDNLYKAIYGTSDILSRHSGIQIIENPHLLPIIEKARKEKETQKEKENKNIHSTFPSSKAVTPLLTKQIETRTPDGRRRITPICIPVLRENETQPTSFQASKNIFNVDSSKEKSVTEQQEKHHKIENKTKNEEAAKIIEKQEKNFKDGEKEIENKDKEKELKLMKKLKKEGEECKKEQKQEDQINVCPKKNLVEECTSNENSSSLRSFTSSDISNTNFEERNFWHGFKNQKSTETSEPDWLETVFNNVHKDEKEFNIDNFQESVFRLSTVANTGPESSCNVSLLDQDSGRKISSVITEKDDSSLNNTPDNGSDNKSPVNVKSLTFEENKVGKVENSAHNVSCLKVSSIEPIVKNKCENRLSSSDEKDTTSSLPVCLSVEQEIDKQQETKFEKSTNIGDVDLTNTKIESSVDNSLKSESKNIYGGECNIQTEMSSMSDEFHGFGSSEQNDIRSPSVTSVLSEHDVPNTVTHTCTDENNVDLPEKMDIGEPSIEEECNVSMEVMEKEPCEENDVKAAYVEESIMTELKEPVELKSELSVSEKIQICNNSELHDIRDVPSSLINEDSHDNVKKAAKIVDNSVNESLEPETSKKEVKEGADIRSNSCTVSQNIVTGTADVKDHIAALCNHKRTSESVLRFIASKRRKFIDKEEVKSTENVEKHDPPCVTTRHCILEIMHLQLPMTADVGQYKLMITEKAHTPHRLFHVKVKLHDITLWESIFSSQILGYTYDSTTIIFALKNRHMYIMDINSGKFIFPPISLSAEPSHILLEHNYLLCITSDAFVSVWNVSRKECIIAQKSIASILMSESVKSNVPQKVSLTGDGCPIITLVNGKAYLYSLAMQCWFLIGDNSDPIIAYSLPAAHQNLPKDPKLLLQSHQSCVTSISTDLPQSCDIGNICTITFLEHQVSSALTLKSPTEFRHWLLVLVQFLLQQGEPKRLHSICEELLRPLQCGKPDDNTILGLSRHSLLKDVLMEIGGYPHTQRLFTEFYEQLTILNST